MDIGNYLSLALLNQYRKMELLIKMAASCHLDIGNSLLDAFLTFCKKQIK
jgi:hypothetical protein